MLGVRSEKRKKAADQREAVTEATFTSRKNKFMLIIKCFYYRSEGLGIKN